jgi:hypothetical protein
MVTVRDIRFTMRFYVLLCLSFSIYRSILVVLYKKVQLLSGCYFGFKHFVATSYYLIAFEAEDF